MTLWVQLCLTGKVNNLRGNFTWQSSSLRISPSLHLKALCREPKVPSWGGRNWSLFDLKGFLFHDLSKMYIRADEKTVFRSLLISTAEHPHSGPAAQQRQSKHRSLVRSYIFTVTLSLGRFSVSTQWESPQLSDTIACCWVWCVRLLCLAVWGACQRISPAGGCKTDIKQIQADNWKEEDVEQMRACTSKT